MSETGKPTRYAPRRCYGLPKGDCAPDPVEFRIAAFLDGASDGSELLHALYDHVLNEPIPQPMRALLDE